MRRQPRSSGLGTVTVLTDSGSDVFGADDEVDLSELGSAGTGPEPACPNSLPSDPDRRRPVRCGWRELEQRFEPALLDGDVDAALDSVVGLHRLILDWAADTNQSPEAPEPNVPCGGCSYGLRVRHNRVYATAANSSVGSSRPCSKARTAARADDRWGEADALRDRLDALGIAVKDTRDGSIWDFVEDGGDG